jgi:hypothetical protein
VWVLGLLAIGLIIFMVFFANDDSDDTDVNTLGSAVLSAVTIAVTPAGTRHVRRHAPHIGHFPSSGSTSKDVARLDPPATAQEGVSDEPHWVGNKTA